MNSKSRKGIYYYLYENGRARYYKKEKGKDVDYYLNKFKQPKRNAVKGFIRKVQRRTSVDKYVTKGSGKTEISEIKRLDNYHIRKAYDQMLKPLVKDKKLREILTKEENISKFKYRIATRITITGEEGKRVTYNCIGKTLSQIKTDFAEIKDVFMGWMHNKITKQKGYKLESNNNVEVDKMYLNDERILRIQRINLNIEYTKGR